jgi:hypothetical protein
MAEKKSYTDVNPDTGRPFLAETPFPTPQRMAEYLRAQAVPNEYTITTGTAPLSIAATEEAYQKAVDAYEQDTGTGKYAEGNVELREPAPPANPNTNADAQAVNRAIPNYDNLTSEQIIDRINSVPTDARAAVVRYETANKNRKGVIAAYGG